ncbi:hypothetical protein [Tahibacter harae]|uniref:PGAP1-like protein n=1 Tax=Tahibacter harae TaxID=2963937 RepID=A0ABT1QQF3_9GAMM|nr:hypothetical protein [Tahibacter harae]MCQ4164520.1 hypothetical protein [Tahibacter harae]
MRAYAAGRSVEASGSFPRRRRTRAGGGFVNFTDAPGSAVAQSRRTAGRTPSNLACGGYRVRLRSGFAAAAGRPASGGLPFSFGVAAMRAVYSGRPLRSARVLSAVFAVLMHCSAAAGADDSLPGGTAHTGLPNPERAAACASTRLVTHLFTQASAPGPDVFFDPRWQQRNYGAACPAPQEMLRFEDAACVDESDPIHPFRHRCSAAACCGAPPPEPPCDQGAEQGLPAEAIDVEAATEVAETRGLLSQLYPDKDTRTGDFRDSQPCTPSIGEEPLPAEVDAPPSDRDLAAVETLERYEQGRGAALAAAQNSRMPFQFPAISIPDDICWRRFDSGSWDIASCAQQLRGDQPFDGRDVIYVHGLATDHLKNYIGNYAPAKLRWPQDAHEFTDSSGYFRQYAERYWRDHIREHLSVPGPTPDPLTGWQWWASSGDPGPLYRPKYNRYLIVAWSSNQRLVYAQHAFLQQVAEAIAYNKNVVTPPNFPANERRPFCANGCVVISHSTGGLLVSSAFGAVQRGDYGSRMKDLLKHIRVHVAFSGAISGSRLATAALAVSRALMPSDGGTHLCRLVSEVFATPALCAVTREAAGAETAPAARPGENVADFLERSILTDLMPVVAQRVWGPVLSGSPVITLTVAGGHPTGNYTTLTKLLLPGIDDGVVSANSACGNPLPVAPDGGFAPSGVIVGSLLKSFDLGDNRWRAAKLLISQKHLMRGQHPGGLSYLAGMCTPYLSATGMVLPVANTLSGTPWDTRARYPNHYSLLQSVADHSYDGGGVAANPWPSAFAEGAGVQRRYLSREWNNIEESSAVTDAGIFQQFPDGTYLVKPAFAQSVEIVRGKKIKFRLFRRTRYLWFWKRTYERLAGWENKQSSHYVYEFVARR